MADADPHVIRIRPVRADARQMVIPIARKNYFQDGGFTVTRDRVELQARSGRRTEVGRRDIASVTLTHSTRGDTRVLLTRADGSVLAQDQSWWYSDGALQRLASAIGVPFTNEPYQRLAKLDRNHSGTLRYRWERHPFLTCVVLTVLVLGPLLLVTALTH